MAWVSSPPFNSIFTAQKTDYVNEADKLFFASERCI